MKTMQVRPLFTLQNACQAKVAKEPPKLYEIVRFYWCVQNEQIANVGIGLGLQNLNNTSSIIVLFSNGIEANLVEASVWKTEGVGSQPTYTT